MHGQDPGYAQCQMAPELLELYDWTQQWLRMETEAVLRAQQECLWRRDLVHLICRNGRRRGATLLQGWERGSFGIWVGTVMRKEGSSVPASRAGWAFCLLPNDWARSYWLIVPGTASAVKSPPSPNFRL